MNRVHKHTHSSTRHPLLSVIGEDIEGKQALGPHRASTNLSQNGRRQVSSSGDTASRALHADIFVPDPGLDTFLCV